MESDYKIKTLNWSERKARSLHNFIASLKWTIGYFLFLEALILLTCRFDMTFFFSMSFFHPILLGILFCPSLYLSLSDLVVKKAMPVEEVIRLNQDRKDERLKKIRRFRQRSLKDNLVAMVKASKSQLLSLAMIIIAGGFVLFAKVLLIKFNLTAWEGLLYGVLGVIAFCLIYIVIMYPVVLIYIFGIVAAIIFFMSVSIPPTAIAVIIGAVIIANAIKNRR